MEEVKTVAVELQDLLQAKVGTTKFSEVYNRVRQGVMSVRRERKSARAVQVCFLLFAFAFGYSGLGGIWRCSLSFFVFFRPSIILRFLRKRECIRMC